MFYIEQINFITKRASVTLTLFIKLTTVIYFKLFTYEIIITNNKMFS